MTLEGRVGLRVSFLGGPYWCNDGVIGAINLRGITQGFFACSDASEGNVLQQGPLQWRNCASKDRADQISVPKNMVRMVYLTARVFDGCQGGSYVSSSQEYEVPVVSERFSKLQAGKRYLITISNHDGCVLSATFRECTGEDVAMTSLDFEGTVYSEEVMQTVHWMADAAMAECVPSKWNGMAPQQLIPYCRMAANLFKEGTRYLKAVGDDSTEVARAWAELELRWRTLIELWSVYTKTI